MEKRCNSRNECSKFNYKMTYALKGSRQFCGDIFDKISEVLLYTKGRESSHVD